MSEQRINEYIEGKYGVFGVDRFGLRSVLFCVRVSMLSLTNVT